MQAMDSCGNIPTLRGEWPGLYDGVMLHFEIDLQLAVMANKGVSRKDTNRANVWSDPAWVVKSGRLVPRGRPRKVPQLFRELGEKLPYSALDSVEKHLKGKGASRSGVYIAHDSMGAPRYIGRGGNVFARLRSHKKTHRLELLYFSFYIVEDKAHEREVETLLIRGASHFLEFNSKKKRVGISPGNIRDYEPGTSFYERQYKKGRKVSKRKAKKNS